MKKIILLISFLLTLVIVFNSCERVEELTANIEYSGYQVILPDGIMEEFQGDIEQIDVSFSALQFTALTINVNDSSSREQKFPINTIIHAGNVVELETPAIASLLSIFEAFPFSLETVRFSDYSAKATFNGLTIFIQEDQEDPENLGSFVSQDVGKLVRTNMKVSNIDKKPYPGAAIASLYYVNQPDTIFGYVNFTTLKEETIVKYTYNYDEMPMVQGWNEIIYVCTKVKGDEYYFDVVANNEPVGMEWKRYDF